MDREVEIDCFDCDGKGWTVTHEWSGYPEQEVCECCEGKKKLIVPAEMAAELGGERDE